MNKYITEKDGVTTTYSFVEGTVLPKELPISTPLTFAFIGQNLVIVKKQTGWWDVIGGKIEDGETWEVALKREAYEEAGVFIDHIELVGYVIAENSGNSDNYKFPKINVIPVTFSFVKEVDYNWTPRETLTRDALQKTEIRKLFKLRSDNDQLLNIYNVVLSEYNKRDYTYSFTYINKDACSNMYPNTQSVTFVKTTDNKFLVAREKDSDKYALPGGGCHMDETPADCARRETEEEVQVEIENIELLGEVIVKVIKNGEILSISKQSRFTADVAKMTHFIPEKDGFETVERGEIPFEKLWSIELLKNDTGTSILNDLKKYYAN